MVTTTVHISEKQKRLVESSCLNLSAFVRLQLDNHFRNGNQNEIRPMTRIDESVNEESGDKSNTLNQSRALD